MNATQRKFQAANGGASQCARIARALRRRAGQWVPMTLLWRVSGAFAVHSRIADLRKQGLAVAHKNEWRGRKVVSFYRLEGAA